MLWWIYWMVEQGQSVARIEKSKAALAFLFKFQGTFREGELVSPSKRVTRMGVELGNVQVDIWRAKSKTDHPRVAGPLLIHEDGTPLTRFQFVKVFRWGVERLGKAQLYYGSHSFRIGAATEAARLALG
ncbi:hypothetical protein XELAEV_18031382mg [Xenopus laevis]|uniref:Tyr recombinase domain-containing protein n=1 Tax=Xenopus laevis TaxID=8355 RepID=A0A974HFK8_XENLA|nr:hypothetical protein XELAEV_18031382mg [Xenopus laevis]